MCSGLSLRPVSINKDNFQALTKMITIIIRQLSSRRHTTPVPVTSGVSFLVNTSWERAGRQALLPGGWSFLRGLGLKKEWGRWGVGRSWGGGRVKGRGRDFIPSWDSFPAHHGIGVPLLPTEQNDMHEWKHYLHSYYVVVIILTPQRHALVLKGIIAKDYDTSPLVINKLTDWKTYDKLSWTETRSEVGWHFRTVHKVRYLCSTYFP